LFEGGMLSLDAFLKRIGGTSVVYWGTSGQRIAGHYLFGSICMKELLDGGVLLHGGDVRGQMVYPRFEQLVEDIARYYDIIRIEAQTTDRSLYSYGWLLDISRCIYTLRTGEIIAKTAAGEWALAEGICPCPELLRKTLDIRKDPLASKERSGTWELAERLGPDVQRFADVLEAELGSKQA